MTAMVVHRDGNRMEPAVGAGKICHPTNTLGSMRLLSTSVGRSNTASFALPPLASRVARLRSPASSGAMFGVANLQLAVQPRNRTR